MGIDGLHRVEVLQVPGQVVLGREGRRPQLRAVVVAIGGGIGIGIGTGIVVVMQGQRVGEGIGIRLPTVAVAVAVSLVLVVVCRRHGVPRARQHSGRACSGGAWASRKPAGLLKQRIRLQAVSGGRIGSEGRQSGQGWV